MKFNIGDIVKISGTKFYGTVTAIHPPDKMEITFSDGYIAFHLEEHLELK